MTDSVIDYGAQSCTVFCCNLELGKILEMDMHVTDCTMFCLAFQFTIGIGVCGLLTNVLDCKASGQGRVRLLDMKVKECVSVLLTQHVQTSPNAKRISYR